MLTIQQGVFSAYIFWLNGCSHGCSSVSDSSDVEAFCWATAFGSGTWAAQ
jgi:hypothetical protein